MTIVPITGQRPTCYGVCCDRHGRCRRYSDVEGPTDPHTIGTCKEGDRFPLFVERELEELRA